MDFGIPLLNLKSVRLHTGFLILDTFLNLSMPWLFMQNVNNNSSYFIQNAVNELIQVKSLTRWLEYNKRSKIINNNKILSNNQTSLFSRARLVLPNRKNGRGRTEVPC